MNATPGETSWERVGELAAQLTACAGDLERFLLDEARHLETLAARAPACSPVNGHPSVDVANVARRARHPGSSDPVIAAVLAQFERLENVARVAANGV